MSADARYVSFMLRECHICGLRESYGYAASTSGILPLRLYLCFHLGYKGGVPFGHRYGRPSIGVSPSNYDNKL
jgi:hypothetical protein